MIELKQSKYIDITTDYGFKKIFGSDTNKDLADQAPKGNRRAWNYAISEVYIIVLMDGFRMPDAIEAEMSKEK